jgi:glyoxylase-like metal-dependent hydrolase (beta-lactamase superfamily II)
MAEPKARAAQIDYLFPWLLHWTIADERIGGCRSDAFALQTPDGLMVVDPLPLTDQFQAKLENVGGIFLTHGNHQRSAWRFGQEFGASVYAPAGAAGLDEEPDVWYDETSTLPGGLQAVRATGFHGACYLVFTHAEGSGVLFCGDLICHDPDGPYRFPMEPGYFDPMAGQEDARRLLDLPLSVLCAAHAVPSLDGCREALQGAISRLA